MTSNISFAMMTHLILLRHGESADRQMGQTDFDRTLTTRGRHSITQLGLYLKSEKIFSDFILSSDAIRAKQTTQTLADALSIPEPSITYDSSLYLGLDLDYRASILKMKGPIKLLIVVGHNPSISSLATIINGHYSKAFQPGQAAFIELMTAQKIGTVKGNLLRFIGPFGVV